MKNNLKSIGRLCGRRLGGGQPSRSRGILENSSYNTVYIGKKYLSVHTFPETSELESFSNKLNTEVFKTVS